MIYLFHGPDAFSIREAVQRQLRAALPAETADLNLTRIPGDALTLDALRFACEALPFLADRRAVVVEGGFSRLGSRRPRERKTDGAERESGLLGDLAGYLPKVPPNTLLIFVEPDAPPRSGPLASALDQAKVKQQHFPVLAGAPLTRWIKERAKTAGAAISDRAAQLLATYVGGDLQTLANEIAKLAAYAGPGREIDAAEVQLLVSQAAEANIFQLVDAIGQRNRSRALASLHLLLQEGERPERIMVMVARQVRLLLQAKDLVTQGSPSDEIARTLGLSPYPARKILEQARLFGLTQLRAMHRRVLEADLHIKTGQHEPALALDLLVAELTDQGRSTSGTAAIRAR
jgi:DNA polymerase-3 subunit delta